MRRPAKTKLVHEDRPMQIRTLAFIAAVAGAAACAAVYAFWPTIGSVPPPPPIVNPPPDLRAVARERTAPGRLEFEKRILDGSEIGVLFPTFADFDGDGKIDLLVGVGGDQERTLMGEPWGEGHLLVYLNRGTNAAPVYAKPYRFDDVVPSGRIPYG
jgi:hypothetical protein